VDARLAPAFRNDPLSARLDSNRSQAPFKVRDIPSGHGSGMRPDRGKKGCVALPVSADQDHGYSSC
jgi:hypothetical protein